MLSLLLQHDNFLSSVLLIRQLIQQVTLELKMHVLIDCNGIPSILRQNTPKQYPHRQPPPQPNPPHPIPPPRQKPNKQKKPYQPPPRQNPLPKAKSV